MLDKLQTMLISSTPLLILLITVLLSSACLQTEKALSSTAWSHRWTSRLTPAYDRCVRELLSMQSCTAVLFCCCAAAQLRFCSFTLCLPQAPNYICQCMQARIRTRAVKHMPTCADACIHAFMRLCVTHMNMGTKNACVHENLHV